MRSALILCLCVTTWAFADERVSLETTTPRDRYYVGEPIRITLRVKFDPEFFESSAVQLFQRELDLPMQIDAPWLDPPASADGPTIALNDSVVPVRSDETGLLAIERTHLTREPGELILSAPRLRYAFATEFREDFIQGRMPVDRHEVAIQGAARSLTILAVPKEGRPGDFSGAVGSALRIRAEASPRTVAAGAIVKLVVTIEGEGNLEEFEAPRLDELAGFHVYGVVEEKGPSRRVITYDIAPLHGEVTEVPRIPFAWFDGPTAGYVITGTEPIPLSVRGEPQNEPLQPDEEAGIWMLLWVGVFALFGLLLWSRMRKQQTRRADPAADFRARGDVPNAFVDYLAARLGCPAAAVISPGLSDRLRQAGAPTKLAAQTGALVEELVAARYGGAAGDDRDERARVLVDALEASSLRGAE